MKYLSRAFIENIISYGIIAALLIIIVRAAVYLFDVNQTNVSFSLLNFVYNIVVLFLCLYLGTVAYRKKTVAGNMSYRKGLLICITISLIAIFIIYVYDIVFHFFIAPDYLSNIIKPQIDAIIINPSISSGQKMELMEKMDKYSSPLYSSSMNALMSFGLSIMISMITAIFTVRKRPIIVNNEQ